MTNADHYAELAKEFTADQKRMYTKKYKALQIKILKQQMEKLMLSDGGLTRLTRAISKMDKAVKKLADKFE